MPVAPNTNQRGLLATSVGDGSNRFTWDQGGGTVIRVCAPYAIVGPTPDYTWPGFFVPVSLTATVGLVAVIAILSAGTITVDALQNGSGITGLTAISVTTSSTGYVAPTTNPTPVADGDYFAITTSSTSGTGDLSFDFIFDILP